MAEQKEVILTQPAGTQLRHGAEVVHATHRNQPLVHMVCWDEEPVRVDVSGKVALTGDLAAPVQVRMAHDFTNVHEQTHRIAPVDHTLHVDSQLHEPIHHALQLRTPLQVRFCNAWHAVSNYTLEIRSPRGPVLSLHLTGATICTPQPCDEKPCPPPVVRQPIHP